jgi:hypothetical protein
VIEPIKNRLPLKDRETLSDSLVRMEVRGLLRGSGWPMREQGPASPLWMTAEEREVAAGLVRGWALNDTPEERRLLLVAAVMAGCDLSVDRPEALRVLFGKLLGGDRAREWLDAVEIALSCR